MKWLKLNISVNLPAILLIIVLCLIFFGCKKENVRDRMEDDPDEGVPRLMMKFDHFFGEIPYHPNEFYAIASGQTVRLNKLRYYVSNIVLHATDGSRWEEPESYHIVDAVDQRYFRFLIDVPAGEYNGISLKIGVDSTRNVSGAQTGALSPEHGMFWSWITGYIFIEIEGESPDVSSGALTYHIGGFSGAENAIQTIESQTEIAFETSIDREPQLHFIINLAEFFIDEDETPIDVSQVHHVKMPGAQAVRLSQNFVRAIHYDHLHL